MTSALLGIVSIGMAVFMFGSFGIFIKIPSVMALELDPIVFQCYKSFWVVVTCWVALFFTDFSFTPYGIVSAVFWIPAGISAIVAIRSIGLSVGEGIWSGLIILVNCLWGIVGFHEDLGNVPVTVSGIVCLSVGIIGIAMSKEYKGKRVQEESEVVGLEEGNGDTGRGDQVREPLVKPMVSEELAPRMKYPKHIGYLAAVFNGLYGGSMYAPMKIAQRNGVKTSGFDYVISFGLGVGIVQVTLLLVYGIIRTLCLRKPFFPNFHFQTLKFAGSAAGICWSIGNFFSILAIDSMGNAVGYSACQAALLVAGFWGIVYFREVKGMAVVLYCFASALTLGGVCMMVYGKQQK